MIGGDCKMVLVLVWVVVVVGIEGLFVEVYDDFDNVFSDGFNMLRIEDLLLLLM